MTTSPFPPDPVQPDPGLPGRIRDLATSATLLAFGHASEAQTALDARNYSRAATEAHRAHQQQLVADALRSVLS